MSSPALPGIFGALEPVLNHYGYLAVAALVMVEDFGLPVPGETIVIAAALYAGAGRLNVVLVGVIATLAAILGDNIGFAIGHFGGRALALRWGKYVFLTAERLDKAEYFFEHHGGKIIVVARFIEGLRQANGIVAGITGMHWKRFFFFNTIGAALWVGVWVSLGYLAGNHITTIYTQITRYSLYVLIALVIVIVAFIAWRLWRRRARQPGRAAAAGTTEVTEAEEVGGTPKATGASAAAEAGKVGNAPEVPVVAPETGGAPEAMAVPGEADGAPEMTAAGKGSAASETSGASEAGGAPEAMAASGEAGGVPESEEAPETGRAPEMTAASGSAGPGGAGEAAGSGRAGGAADADADGTAGPPMGAEPAEGWPPVSPNGTARRPYTAAESLDEGENGSPG